MWGAVLGCLLHLVSKGGYVVRGYLEGLSMKVVRALMQCSLAHQWGDTLYCHLVRLAANMMYVPGATHAPGDPQAPCPSQPMLYLSLLCCYWTNTTFCV